MAGRRGKGLVVSRAELAEFFGVSLTTIDHWVRSGAPFVTRGGPGRQWAFSTAEVAVWREDRIRADAAGAPTRDANELRLRHLAAQTALAELELAKAKGEVAPVDQMQRAMASAFAEVRANIRNVPARAVLMLIGETDEVRFKKVLMAEIDKALAALAEADLVDEADIDPDEDET